MLKTPSPSARGLRRRDRDYLQGFLKRTTSARAYRRARAVLLIAEGLSVVEAAQVAGISRQSAYDWLRIYRQQRTACNFADASRSGRPSAARQLSDQQIRDLLAQSPFDLGYLSSGWTAELLCQYVRDHHGLSITQRTMRRRLGELEIRWKRPRYIFSEPDPHRAQKKGASSDA